MRNTRQWNFVERFLRKRAAIALTTDDSIVTSIGNDFRFEADFRAAVKAIGPASDVATGISAKWEFPNVLRGLKAARDASLQAIVLNG